MYEGISSVIFSIRVFYIKLAIYDCLAIGGVLLEEKVRVLLVQYKEMGTILH